MLASTGASVARAVSARNPAFRSALQLVLTDRPCGAMALASEIGVPCEVNAGDRDSESFSEWVLERLIHHQIDHVFVFFTRLLSGRLLERYADRLVNFHPSLLPAHPGLRGFEDSVRSRAPLIGSTVHLIDGGMDTGPIIMQSVLSVDPRSLDVVALRHRVFLTQCAQLEQVFFWLDGGRIQRAGKAIIVDGGQYATADAHFPALDSIP